MLALGTLMIGAATAAASDGAEGIYGLFFVWIVLVSFLFFSRRSAALQAVFAAVVYGTVLIAGDAPYAASLLIVACATIGTTGAIVGLLRGPGRAHRLGLRCSGAHRSGDGDRQPARLRRALQDGDRARRAPRAPALARRL